MIGYTIAGGEMKETKTKKNNGLSNVRSNDLLSEVDCCFVCKERSWFTLGPSRYLIFYGCDLYSTDEVSINVMPNNKCINFSHR
jgi:hypothetical protein